MPTLITLSCAIVFVFLTGSHGDVCAQDPAAVIVTCTGDVKIVGIDDDLREATFGAHVSSGETLRTAIESAAEFVLPSGTLLRLGPESEMQIGAPDPDRASARTVGGAESFQDVRQLLTLKDHRGTSAVSALRSTSGVGAIDELQPRETAIRPGRPVFHWTTTDSIARLSLRIYSDGNLVHEAGVQGTTSWIYPESAPDLEPGTTYSWLLEIDDPLAAPLRSPTAFFRVISRDDVLALEDRLSMIEDAGASPLASAILRASAFRSRGLVRDAVREIEAHRRQTASPELDRILVQLLLESGRSAEAVTVLNGPDD